MWEGKPYERAISECTVKRYQLIGVKSYFRNERKAEKVIELVLFMLLVLMVLVAVCKLLIKAIELMVPIILKKRIAENEAQRIENIRELQEMGIEIFTGEDYPRNWSSVR